MTPAHQLLADRFLAVGGRTIDLATGHAVQVELEGAATRAEQAAWSESCAQAARLRHPLARPLVDFGVVDASRRFLAFDAEHAPGRRPDPASLRHARRFFEAYGVGALLRPRRVVPLLSARPVGIVLQARRALVALTEAFAASAPAGVAALEVCGPPGSGMGTLLVLAARELRLRGFVPIAPGMLAAYPACGPLVARRHLAILVADGSTAQAADAAALALDRARDTGRRHLLIRFGRGTAAPSKESIMIDSLTTAALTAMVARDRWSGPTTHDVAAAVHHAGGLPGAVLRGLGGAAALTACHAPAARETSPAYVVSARPGERPPGRVARMLWDAAEQGQRLAARGRHAAAIRLLERAARVLESRGEHAIAGAAAIALGWILRSRGRTREARACFDRLVDGARTAQTLAAMIAVGVLDTDTLRFTDAETALRSAVTAASVLDASELEADARLALARCLLHDGRHAEGLAVLRTATAPSRAPLVHALTARLHAAAADVPAALSAATAACACLADGVDGRVAGTAWRALAEARLLAGDSAGAADAARRGIRAAADAHLPLLALKCRLAASRAGMSAAPSLAARRSRPSGGTASRVPPLLRQALERPPEAAALPVGASPPAPLAALRRYLDAVQAAADDLGAARAICDLLAAELGAADVAVLEAPDARALARTGRALPGAGCGARAITTGTVLLTASLPLEAAVPIRYGGAVLGAIECRIAAGRDIHPPALTSALEAAAVALEAPLRAIADRRAEPTEAGCWPDLLGTSAPALGLRQAILAAARAPFPVLIEGESGSGKELVARAIHRLGPRAARRLCALNCAAVSDDLLEAELFGHTRGAFTGAVAERAGLFEDADGGTLFLDEIGELSPRAQAKLLRALQDGEVRRVGESFSRRVNPRVVAATNRNLAAEVAAGRFRADLRFRLDVIRITVPPLRDRAGDIPQLAAHFWREAAARVGSRATLTPETLAALSRCEWPGNIRELQNVVAALAVHGPRRGRIPPAMLPASIARHAAAAACRFEEAREEFERRFVRAALAAAGGHRARAARALGVSRQGLAKMLRRLRIDAAEAGDAGAGG